MPTKRNCFLPAFLALSLFLSISGCGDDSSSSMGAGPGENESTGATDLIYAEDWSQLNLQANFAKTQIDYTGHYMTSRNACGKDAGGAMEKKVWNEFAQALNEASRSQMTAEKKTCIPYAPESKMDGTAELVMSDGTKVSLFENINSDSCTGIADQALAQRVYKAINDLVNIADKQDCANGWGG